MEKYDLQEGNESLKKILLMMKYDNKKTLSENVEIINEQGLVSTLKNVATGAATGAATGFAAFGVGAIPGAVVGGLIGLASTFIGTQNFKSTKQLFEGCKTDKSLSTLTTNQLDEMSDRLNGAMEGFGTNEKEIESVFKSVPSIPDLCALINNYGEYHGDLFSDLDGDLEGDKEWKKYVWLPLRGAMRFTANSQKQLKDDTPSPTTDSKYKQCNGPEFEFYCVNKVWIAKLQKCIGARPDGYFGPKTLKLLQGVRGFENFAQNDTITTEQIKSICDSKQQSNNNEKSSQDKVVIKKQTSGNTNNNQTTQIQPTSAATLDDVLGEPTKQD